MDAVGEQVKEFCARATDRLYGFSFDEKRLALEALQIKVVVGTGGVKLFGVIPSSYATIEQTSGCMLGQRVNGIAERLGFTDILSRGLASFRR